MYYLYNYELILKQLDHFGYLNLLSFNNNEERILKLKSSILSKMMNLDISKDNYLLVVLKKGKFNLYEVDTRNLLGDGDESSIYQGRNIETHELAAIKSGFFDSDHYRGWKISYERFQGHPNFVQSYAIGNVCYPEGNDNLLLNCTDSAVLVMEQIENAITLSQIGHRVHVKDLWSTDKIAAFVSSSFDAHEEFVRGGIFGYDNSQSNILIDKHGTIKLCDFNQLVLRPDVSLRDKRLIYTSAITPLWYIYQPARCYHRICRHPISRMEGENTTKIIKNLEKWILDFSGRILDDRIFRMRLDAQVVTTVENCQKQRLIIDCLENLNTDEVGQCYSYRSVPLLNSWLNADICHAPYPRKSPAALTTFPPTPFSTPIISSSASRTAVPLLAKLAAAIWPSVEPKSLAPIDLDRNVHSEKTTKSAHFTTKIPHFKTETRTRTEIPKPLVSGWRASMQYAFSWMNNAYQEAKSYLSGTSTPALIDTPEVESLNITVQSIENSLVVANCVSQIMQRYSPVSLPWNRTRSLSDSEEKLLKEYQETLSGLTSQFKARKNTRAYRYGMNADRYTEMEYLLNKVQQLLTHALEKHTISSASLAEITRGIQQLKTGMVQLTNRTTEKTLRAAEIQEARLKRRTTRTGKTSPSSAVVFSAAAQTLGQKPLATFSLPEPSVSITTILPAANQTFSLRKQLFIGRK